MKTDLVGLIYTGDRDEENLGELTRVRSVAALPMLGRYRLIDFLLSNMVNSGIKNIGIIMQRNYKSLLDQLGSGRDWDLHGKRSGMTLLPPFVDDNKGTYTGLLQALKCNLSFLRRSKEKYIVVADCNSLYHIKFDELLEQHKNTDSDITLVYTKDRNARRNSKGRYLSFDSNKNLNQIEFDPVIPNSENTYIGVFLIRREILINLVERSISVGHEHFMRDTIRNLLEHNLYKVSGYELPSRIWLIDSIQAYFQANLDILKFENQAHIFKKDRPIWTKLKDEIPSKYSSSSSVKNSLVADGCNIEGTVENSILFRGVTIKKGAIVRGSIVMQDSYISTNAEVENCILEKQTDVRENKRIISVPNYPIVVAKNITI